MKTQYHKWTEAEKDFIKHVYGKLSLSAIARKLCVKDSQLDAQIKLMGIFQAKNKKWTEEDFEYIKAHYQEPNGSAICAKHLGRSAQHIRSVAFHLGLSTPGRKQYNAWTPEEDAYLREHYHNTHTVLIAEHVGRPCGSVSSRASILGLHKDPDMKYAKFRRRTKAELAASLPDKA